MIQKIRNFGDNHPIIRELIISLCILLFFTVGQMDGKQDGIRQGQILCNDFIIETFYYDSCIIDSDGNYVCLNKNDKYNVINFVELTNQLNLSGVITDEKYQDRKEKYN